MKIVKNNGSLQDFNPNKILTRIKKASKGLKINHDDLFKSVVQDIKEGMSTKDIDECISFRCADRIIEHPDYSKLGGRILVSTWAKHLNIELQPIDEDYNFFSAYTFFNKYAKKDSNGNPIEIPSSMYERVSEYLYGDSPEDKAELLEDLTNKRSNFSTPIYTNSSVDDRNSLISCNLTELIEDSLEGIEITKTNIAKASKEGSGIGFLVDNLRSKHSLVSSFKGYAGGVVRLADMVQSTMRFYKQGSRSGSCALYLSLWHRDIFDFLSLRLPIGEEKERARDLFLGVVVNDLFMEKLLRDESWFIFCPNEIKKAGLPPLYEVLGEEFNNTYNKAVELGLGHETTARKIFDAIIKSQVESGNPYVFYKENANRNNMQDNIGVIKQSNLCVHGDTLVLTKEGEIPIKELEALEVSVWNGEQWSETVVRKTNVNQRLLSIKVHQKISNGEESSSVLNCTEYHTWFSEEGVKIHSKDLEVGLKLLPYINNEGLTVESYIEDFIPFNGLHDTYCFTEPLRGMGVFNNILTGNCAEITSVSKPGYTSQCTLSSINLGAHDNLETIAKSTKILVKTLNKIIDKNKWSDEASREAGIDQRSLAIGVAGLADFFFKKKISFESEEAKEWTHKIFETIYKSAVCESNRLAEESMESYPAWKGSKYEKGETYIEGWSPKEKGEAIPMKNSLLVGLMPTASSAILLGVFESFEPVTANFFNRTVGQGEFLVVNEYLVKELEELDLWNEDMRDKIISNRGSVQTIMDIPQDIRYRYKDVWEIPQKKLLDLAVIRNKYVDQSQSLNVYHADADYNKIASALIYAWQNGLKTGVYYTRTKSKLRGNADMAVSKVTEKPKESVFECDGCSA